MNVCFICNEYPPGPHGGIGTATQVLARGLVRAGHSVRVVGVYPPEHPGPSHSDDQGVQVVRLQAPSYRLGWISARYGLYRVVSAWSRAGEIDIVEVPDWEGWAAFWPHLGVPVIARVNGSATYFAAELGKTPPTTLRRLEGASLRRAGFWCSVSKYTADKTRQVFSLPTGPDAILYNPVEVPPAYPAAPARSRNDVVFTGTLTIKKGVVSLVKAWRGVLDACPTAKLHIYGKDGQAPGGGSMREYLQSQLTGPAADTVHFHGHKDREVVLEALQRARLAVFPSYAEAFALAPLEAMACGCPTIYSVRGSGPELIEDGANGLLVEPDKPEEIAEAIISLMKDDKLTACVGEAGRCRVVEHFALETTLPQNEAFYEQCIARFARRARAGREVTARVAPASSTDPSHDVDIVTRFHSGEQCGLEEPDPIGDTSLKRGVTVAICTYKRAASLERFLHSLAEQDRKPERLVIVDASPDDQTEQMIKGYGAPGSLAGCILYFRVAGRHRGLTRQRNFALRWASTDLVAFFDDDVVLLEGCLREMERAHGLRGEEIAAVGALILNETAHPDLRWRVRRRLRIVPDLQPGMYYRSGISIPWDFLQPTEDMVEGSYLPGCSMMWKTASARQMGFNEFFDGYSSGEDLEFSLRMGQTGKLLVNGKARLLHLHEASGRPDAYAMGYMTIRNAFYIHRTCLNNRTWRDVARFAYSYGFIALIHFANLFRPGRTRDALNYLRGYARFLRQLPGMGPEGARALMRY